MEHKKQALLWLTDGDFDPDNLAEIVANSKILSLKTSKNPINTYILGLGTSEGSAIPLSPHNGSGGWLESAGQGVVSRMDSIKLQQLSVKR